jgi:hypothetical protein
MGDVINASRGDAEKPLLECSDAELRRRYVAELQIVGPGLPMIDAEMSRRITARSSERLNRLTILISAMTAVLVVVAVLQVVVALQSKSASASQALATAPAFKQVGSVSIYCSHGLVIGPPCTAQTIFRNEGGLGTRVATFTAAGVSQPCEIVIASTSEGSETHTSCVFATNVPTGATVSVSISP